MLPELLLELLFEYDLLDEFPELLRLELSLEYDLLDVLPLEEICRGGGFDEDGGLLSEREEDPDVEGTLLRDLEDDDGATAEGGLTVDLEDLVEGVEDELDGVVLD